ASRAARAISSTRSSGSRETSMSHPLEVISNIVTPFASDGSLDEAALGAHVDRTAQAGVGIFAVTPGSGACHSLSLAEYGRVCEVSVEAAGGRVPVYAMTPELHDVELMLDYARAAAGAGVDEVQLFQLMGGHGMKATRDEQWLYWRTCLSALDHPVALS